ncbi:hypothetical protein JANAI62_04500 [Jannaschia pagri]|uniref:Zinc finger/thioredoxin putative domain-containing protein n=1 Tax=Jannaschia pagri TaxID=2829797 RepID=A0ABQ4NHE6_9RHOB|nr:MULTISPECIES: zinc-ribbon domain-containing protein [unclassified Jannaschia]GIT90067.1 hypothetical protein JANAI61_05250 [Jannaschia sp. AI_61]GIT93827.1 hypothetical protein JANAI62_04500 [Jannaschia sp. AI_62]
MRLTCPNCNAQYEVPADMIPVDGREVQCSNCATTWFQEGRARAETGGATAQVRRAIDSSRQSAEPVAQAAAEDPPQAPSVDDAPVASEPDPQPKPEPEPAPRRPMADEKTLDILRQERAHEARKRAAERRRRPMSPPAEVAPEPSAPVDDVVPEPVEKTGADLRAAAAAERERMAAAALIARSREAEAADIAPPAPPPARQGDAPPRPMTGAMAAPTDVADDDMADVIAMALRDAESEDGQGTDFDDDLEDADDLAGQRRAARRDLLPDIEEINSSLRPDDRVSTDSDALDDDQTPVATKRGAAGFGLGFGTMVMVAVAAVAVYLFAIPLAEAVPELARPLQGYAAWVDSLRVALETQIEGLAAAVLADG